MQLLLEINPNIFHLDDPEGKHMRPHITHSLHPNPYSHFIDFTQIKDSEKLPKEVKNILFRPQKLARLGEVYKKLAVKLTNSFERKRLEEIENQHVKYKRVGFQARYPRK